MLVKWLHASFNDHLPVLITILACTTAIAPLAGKIAGPCLNIKSNLLKCILCPPWAEIVLRQLGGLLVLLIYIDAGPEFLCHDATGNLVLFDILPVVFVSLLVGGLFLPFLPNFGLPEVCGVFMRWIMRPIFKVPGNSTVTCIASWFGDNCVGILITDQLYEKGMYTTREAAIISTTFPTVSITYSVIIIMQVDLVHLFLPFYLTVCLAGLVVAMIVPRLPPLAAKPDTYGGYGRYVGSGSVAMTENVWPCDMEHTSRQDGLLARICQILIKMPFQSAISVRKACLDLFGSMRKMQRKNSLQS